MAEQSQNRYYLGAWSSTRMGRRPKKGTGAWVYRWGLRRGHSFNLWLLTTVFQPKKKVIEAHIRENMKMGYTGRTSVFLPTVKTP